MNDALISRNRHKIMMNVTTTQEDVCWQWTGQISHSGYGRIMLKDEEGNKMHSAHRASYALFTGDIHKDGIIVQSCGNRLCVNPSHLKQIFQEDR